MKIPVILPSPPLLNLYDRVCCPYLKSCTVLQPEVGSILHTSKLNAVLCFVLLPLINFHIWMNEIISFLSTKIIKRLITRSSCWTVWAPLPHPVHGASNHVSPHTIVAGYQDLVPPKFLQMGNFLESTLKLSLIPHSWLIHIQQPVLQPRQPECSAQLQVYTWTCKVEGNKELRILTGKGLWTRNQILGSPPLNTT